MFTDCWLPIFSHLSSISDELERQFIDSRCVAVITDGDHLEKVLKSVKKCPLVKVILCVRPPAGSLPPMVYSWKEACNSPIRAIPPYPNESDLPKN